MQCSECNKTPCECVFIPWIFDLVEKHMDQLGPDLVESPEVEAEITFSEITITNHPQTWYAPWR